MNLNEPFLTDPKQIKAWLDSVGVQDWKINEAGLVDVTGTVFLKAKLGSLTKLPVRFGKVGGHFWCDHNQLVSLEGAPKKVGRDFYGYENQIVSLEGAPKEIGGSFWCDHNLLVDFKGMEGVSIGMDFVVTDPNVIGQDNVFVSLDGLPKELYSQVVGLDVQVVLELENRRATNLLGAKIDELSSEVGLG